MQSLQAAQALPQDENESATENPHIVCMLRSSAIRSMIERRAYWRRVPDVKISVMKLTFLVFVSTHE
jgi:hypothetical protein